MILRNSVRLKVFKYGEDSHKLVRWSLITLRGRQNWKKILLTYRVCQQNIERIGSSTTTAPQPELTRNTHNNTLNLVTQTVIDLTHFITSFINQHH